MAVGGYIFNRQNTLLLSKSVMKVTCLGELFLSLFFLFLFFFRFFSFFLHFLFRIIFIWICISRNLYFLDEEISAGMVTCSQGDGLWAIPEKNQRGERGLRT